jgi:hypothetical protein
LPRIVHSRIAYVFIRFPDELCTRRGTQTKISWYISTTTSCALRYGI